MVRDAARSPAAPHHEAGRGRRTSRRRCAGRAGNSEVGRLMEALAALGQDVRVTVTPTKKRVGEMDVVVG